jgi:putative hydrolase of the HAD superfamily
MTDADLLLVDADDTLWENNIYFERVIANFIARLNHGTLSAVEVRERLNEIERRHVRSHGYGLRSFSRALAHAYQELAERPPDEEAVAAIAELAATIANEPIEILPGVPETLAYLAERYRLALFTKGDEAEQASKIERSGLGVYFSDVRIVAEKHADTYQAALEEFGCAPERAWMIGNSPRSDINPALQAGLGAVYIAHPSTWVLEHEQIACPAGARLIELTSFKDLTRHF